MHLTNNLIPLGVASIALGCTIVLSCMGSFEFINRIFQRSVIESDIPTPPTILEPVKDELISEFPINSPSVSSKKADSPSNSFHEDPLNISPSRESGILNQSSISPEEVLQLKDFFSSIGFSFESKTVDCSDEFIIPDISLRQIEKIITFLNMTSGSYAGECFYSNKDQAICLKLTKSKTVSGKNKIFLRLPRDKEWSSLLRPSDRENESSSFLLLANGSKYSKQEFIHHPLFAHTLEKHSVFRHLQKLIENPTFQENYQKFLTTQKIPQELLALEEQIQQAKDEMADIRELEKKSISLRRDMNCWADTYNKNPEELAYISLFAYLNKEIDQEELFITQMLASVFFENPENGTYTVLDQNNIKKHLIENNYITDKDLSEIPSLREIDKASLIKRTSISYDCSMESDEASTLKDERSYFKIPLFGLNIKKQKLTITMLPPHLIKEIYAFTIPCKERPPTSHVEYFGYRRKFSDLLNGRPISYASILFFLPDVHELDLTQVGITAHDLLLHCPVDWINPHTNAIIKLGKELLQLKNQKLKPLIIGVLDRAVTPICLAEFLQATSQDVPTDARKTIYKICKFCLPKEFTTIFHTYGSTIENGLKD